MSETPLQEQKTEPAEAFIAKVREKLDRVPSMFVQPKFLHEIGIFGSHSAATHAVQNGALPHVRVSPYRLLILKSDVLSFLGEKYRAKAEFSA